MKAFILVAISVLFLRGKLASAEERSESSNLRSDRLVSLLEEPVDQEMRDLATKYTVKLYVKHDGYPEETSWSFKKSDGTLYASEAEGSVTTANHLVTKQFKLPAGSYTFIINDSEEDGTCCDASGNGGSIRFEMNGVAFYDEKGDFLSTRRVSFTLPISPS